MPNTVQTPVQLHPDLTNADQASFINENFRAVADVVSTINTTAEILAKVYPVGSIYISTVSTNPATLFGFGTWTAYAAGRTIIGVGTSDNSFSAGATGGESNHTLTNAEMPSHQHKIGFSSGGYLPQNATPGGVIRPLTAHPVDQNGTISDRPADNGSGYGALIQAEGGGNAHNNLPPYIVSYIWQRTA